MHTVFIVVTVNLATFGFASFLGGYLSLAVPCESEVEEARRAYEREREKGFWKAQAYSFQQARRSRVQAFSKVAEHWPERPQSRWLVIGGASCLIGAGIIAACSGALS